MEEQQIRAVLFTRYPVAGAAKTRLIPTIGAAGAARVHKLLTEHSVAAISGSDCRLEIAITGAEESQFSKWLGDGHTYVQQPEGDLSERLIASLSPAPVLFFGSDTPDLGTAHVNQAILALHTHDVVVGPAVDGGYYCIGLRKKCAFLFENMPWSTDQVLPETLRRINERNLSCALLEELRDCDTGDDLAHWPWLAEAAGVAA